MQSQTRNTRDMKNQGNMTPPKVCNSSVTESKDIEMVEIPAKNNSKYYFKKNDQYLKKDSNSRMK
jgi:hypothetical protein